MGSNDHLPVPDPQPKPVAELLADIMERNANAMAFQDRWPSLAIRKITGDVPRMVKALDACVGMMRMVDGPIRPDWVEHIARILSGQEENPDA
jgi:hypothetical protein